MNQSIVILLVYTYSLSLSRLMYIIIKSVYTILKSCLWLHVNIQFVMYVSLKCTHVHRQIQMHMYMYTLETYIYILALSLIHCTAACKYCCDCNLVLNHASPHSIYICTCTHSYLPMYTLIEY